MTSVLAAPRHTSTETNGKSWGGAQTTTTTQYEEHTVTNGEAFSSSESWGTATAVDSAHAADLWFTYRIANSGDEYAREIADLAFNVYIGDDPNPATTYFVAADVGGDGKFHNFMPGESHQYTSARISLTLEQMKAIDLGGPLRVVVEDYSYGIDELFYQDAANASVLLAIEDGLQDGDEAIDTYLVPTWGEETVLDVLARYFPHTADAEGDLVALWTPEPDASGTPSWCDSPQTVGGTLWCQHAISTADWWNIYTDGLGDGSEALHETPAAAGGTALFRFNKDSDLDGYSDRSEIKLGTDEQDPADHPQPELLTGMTEKRSSNDVTATLAFLNTGSYDAYGVEAVLYAPDDSVTVTNNTVGGSGRVKAGQQVVVGGRILDSVTGGAWGGTAQPFSDGYYLGDTDRTYTFTAQQSGAIGSGTLTFNWSDGAGGSGSISAGSGYLSPNFIPVALGVEVGFLSGSVQAGNSFTVEARTPRDTFQYTINRTPYTPPVAVVSYNDPQGNHRFITPITLTHLTDDLQPYSGQMLLDPGVEIVTDGPVTTAGSHTTDLIVNNPAGSTMSQANLFMEFVNITGTVVAEFPVTTDLPAGPSVVPVTWDTSAFSPAFDPAEDYIVMAFFTDWQGNIIDTAARPLSSFQVDPAPSAAIATADLTWDFGTAAQGEILQHDLTVANAGFLNLLAYVDGPPEISLSQAGGRAVNPADTAAYRLTLDTTGLPAGPYNATITLRTSDAGNSLLTVNVTGTIDTVTPTAKNSVERPLDLAVTIPGSHNQGEWVEFAADLGADPQSLHPVKVYDQDYSQLFGVGKYVTDFGQGTGSADMFGDGRDGVMPASGNLDNNNGFGLGSVTGTAGSTSVSVVDRNSVSRINSGDVVLIHQTQGAGNWEMNKAVSDFTGSGTFTLLHPLQHTYSSGAQIMRVPQYSTCNVTGAVTPLKAWDGTTGGIFAVMCSGAAQIAGCLIAKGSGYQGGDRGEYNDPVKGQGWQGTSYIAGSVQSRSANNGGGGGGQGDDGSRVVGAGGGGGGHATAGLAGQVAGSPASQPGAGGGTYGIADLTSAMLPGSGGGGGGSDDSENGPGGYGGSGGGIIIFSANNLNISGQIMADGGNGLSGPGTYRTGGGGGGAGGAILLRGYQINLGTNLAHAIGGSGAPGTDKGGTTPKGGDGGNGGNGRVYIQYCDTVSGATNPIATSEQIDCYMVEQIETSPYNTARLSLPETISTGQTYQVQYGRKLDFAAAGEQVTSLRVSGLAYLEAALNALVSGVTAAIPPCGWTSATPALGTGRPPKASAEPRSTPVPIWPRISAPPPPANRDRWMCRCGSRLARPDRLS